MQPGPLDRAVALAGETRQIFIATVDPAGWPHMASAHRLALRGDGRLSVAEWFCPSTLDNLQRNRRVALVVWDPRPDIGYQLLGEVEQIRDLSVMDGYLPGEIDWPRPPQVERELIVRVERVLLFTHAPHCEFEEEEGGKGEG